MWCQNIRNASFSFVTIHASDRRTDRQTDRRTDKIATTIPLYDPPFGRLRGNLRTPSIVRWKAVVDFLFAIIELFHYLLRLRRYKQKSVEVGRFLEGVAHFERKFRTEEGVAYQPLVSEDYSDCPFMWYQNIRSALFCFVVMHACEMA